MAAKEKSSAVGKLVATISTSREDSLDPAAVKSLKTLCRHDPSAVGRTFQAILAQLGKPNAAIRLNCWQLIEQLFDRSHAFRLLVVESLEELVHLAAGTDPCRPLPPPKAVASRLQADAIRAVRGWVERFSAGYPQLRVSHAVLKRTVDFSSLSLVNDVDAVRRRREEEREADLWRERLELLRQALSDTAPDMEAVILQAQNSLDIWNQSYREEEQDPDRQVMVHPEQDSAVAHQPEKDSTVVGQHEQESPVADDRKQKSRVVDQRKQDIAVVNQQKQDSLMTGPLEQGCASMDKREPNSPVDDQEEQNKAIVESLVDQHRELSKRWLPLVKKWIDTLTKAGRRTDHQLLRQCIEKKNDLEKVFEALVKTNIDFQAHQPSDSLKPGQGSRTSCSLAAQPASHDPTTWAATLSRVEASRLTNLPRKLMEQDDTSAFLADKEPQTSKAAPSASCEAARSIFDTEEPIPRVRLADLVTPQVVEVDGERTSVWLNGSRAGQTFVINPGVKRVIEFSGKFQPVTWRCGAPLPSGQLCPRQDRFRCPLHGPIVPRDPVGVPIAPEGQPKPSLAGPAKEKKKRAVKASRRLASVYSKPATARSRIEKKIFERSAVKRVAEALNTSDAKRTGAKFADQFNYAMQK